MKMDYKLFTESGFQFDFSNSVSAYKADNPNYNGLSAVDFIVETPDEYLFIEVKNPDNKKTSQEARKAFKKEMMSSEYAIKLSSKFKDSLLKELAMNKEFAKPIIYILFLEFDEFDSAQRRFLYERVSSRIPRFAEEDVYKSVKRVRFYLHNRLEFLTVYDMFDVTEL